MFDVNCALLTPTRIKSLVPNVYPGGSRPNSASHVEPPSSSSLPQVVTSSHPAPASSGYYVPKTIRSGYTHSMVFLEYHPTTSQQSSAPVPVLSTQSSGSTSSSHSMLPLLSNSGSSSGHSSVASSPKATILQSRSMDSAHRTAPLSRSTDITTPLGNTSSGKTAFFSGGEIEIRDELNQLFHMLKYHPVDDVSLGIAHVSGGSTEVESSSGKIGHAFFQRFVAAFASLDSMDNRRNKFTLWTDPHDDNNTLLISACKYAVRPMTETGGVGMSMPEIRMQILNIIKYLINNTYQECSGDNPSVPIGTSSSAKFESLVNNANSLGHTALHYCFHHSNNKPAVSDGIDGCKLGEMLLSRSNSFVRIARAAGEGAQGNDIEVLVKVDDVITNKAGLTCYEGLVPEDLDRM
mgnify:CR=1 FL=1